jgi:trimeric autotransporter adhesin
MHLFFSTLKYVLLLSVHANGSFVKIIKSKNIFKMKKITLSVALILAACGISFGQNVGIGTTNPDASALLELKATNRGFLPPRMTAAEKGLIAAPKAGLMIYQTDGTKGLYVFDGGSWVAVTTPAGAAVNTWSLTGNASTDPVNNFIGTTDAKPLIFRVDNAYAGRIDNGGMVAMGIGAANVLSDSTIVAIGYKSLVNNGNGVTSSGEAKNNSAVGSKTLLANTIGDYNAAFGSSTLTANTTGRKNTGLGSRVLVSNATGIENTATGFGALGSNITGNGNTANGSLAAYANTTGSGNVAMGTGALFENTTSSYLVAIGDSALMNNGVNVTQFGQATGNTAVGSKALRNNQTGYSNTATGMDALRGNEVGIFNTANGYQALRGALIGNYNTAVGVQALYSNATGSNNTAMGNQALYYNKANNNTASGNGALYFNNFGNNNTASGNQALLLNTGGNNNSAFGVQTLFSNTTGYSNVAIGATALYKNVSGHNIVAIGDSALYNQQNTVDNDYRNTAVGSKAMYKNVVGYGNTAVGFETMTLGLGSLNTGVGNQTLSNNQSGDENTSVGSFSMERNLTGDRNTTLGNLSMTNNTQGFDNVALGHSALFFNLAGDNNAALGVNTLHENLNGYNNVAIGSNALNTNISGNNNIAIGFNADVLFDNLTNATAIGSKSLVACSNCVVLGAVKGSNGATVYTKTAIGTSSPSVDLHIKQSNETVTLNGGGLRLERVTNSNHWDLGTNTSNLFELDYNGVTKGFFSTVDGSYSPVSDERMKKDINNVGTIMPSVMKLRAKTYHYNDNKAGERLSYGFIAQEVEKLFPEFVVSAGPEERRALSYQNFSVIAIKALQEQQEQMDVLKTENKILKEKMEKLEAVIEAIQQKIK